MVVASHWTREGWYDSHEVSGRAGRFQPSQSIASFDLAFNHTGDDLVPAIDDITRLPSCHFSLTCRYTRQ
jgi:hypothetical protein